MRTKIVCTIGPASEREDTLRNMIRAGMDVARLNMSHGEHEDHARRLALIRRVAAEEHAAVSIMADLQGPKFRVGDLPPDGVTLVRGQPVVLLDSRTSKTEARAGETMVPMPHPELIAAMRVNNRVLIDDGALELRVAENPSGNASVRCEVIAGGVLTSRKGVAVPGAKVAMSSLTPKDRIDLRFAVEHGVDAVAMSFVRTSDDLRELRALVRVLCSDTSVEPHIVAKIEKPEAIQDFEAILKVTDIVMVARGDLGVETSAQEVPFYQKRIIRDCVRAGVPVITATQMLQSMIKVPSPTRAEASDVANAVLDGTDAVMLSAESATGDYPVESVSVMQSILRRAEAEGRAGTVHQVDWHTPAKSDRQGDEVGRAMTIAAVEIAEDIQASAIVCLTASGYTARMVGRLRPEIPIIALSHSARACALATFMRGVQAMLIDNITDVDVMFDEAGKLVCERGLAKPGDRIIIVAGVPLGHGTGKTNLVKVQTV